jgi:hypothetical protein
MFDPLSLGEIVCHIPSFTVKKLLKNITSKKKIYIYNIFISLASSNIYDEKNILYLIPSKNLSNLSR